MIEDVDDRQFDRVVQGASVPVLIEFWQAGCPACQVLLGELEQLQRVLGGRILMLKMNVKEKYQIPAELDISWLPAFALYYHGEFERFTGGRARKEEIKKQLPLS